MNEQPMVKTALPHDDIQLASIGQVASGWQKRLPVLSTARVTLRELRQSDCTSLLSMLNTEEVGRLMSPPPSTLEGFERFVSWSRDNQRAGKQAWRNLGRFLADLPGDLRRSAEEFFGKWNYALPPHQERRTP